jgi:molybdopterin/thiamine biosynthesis adenylyltransferase
LINDACVIAQKPFSHAGILRFQGQLMTYVPKEGPCYRCVFTTPPPPDTVPTCSQAGVVGAMGGVIGSLQAMEAIKYFSKAGKLLAGTLLTYDALTMDFRRVKLPVRRDCAVCGPAPSITKPADYAPPVCEGIEI